MSTTTGRSPYLLDGRRVTLADLLDAGMIEVGARLRFPQNKYNRVHFAEVTEGGGIRLKDGQEFKSPSRAAIAATGAKALDGWTAWYVEPPGVLLDALRQELLEKATTGIRPVGNTPKQATAAEIRRHKFLSDARERADASKPVNTTVRKLLGYWHAKGRGAVINQRIEADLANHGLLSLPSFRAVPLDATIQLNSSLQQQFASETSSTVDLNTNSGSSAAANAAAPEDEGPDIGLTVGNLPSAMGGVVAVSPTATFEEAITQMVLHGYSQLAVQTSKYALRGAVTWESIARARNASPNAKFTDAIILAREISYDNALIDILPRLQESDFVFVRNEKNEISGIVTSTDVVATYEEMAGPFFLIGELDQRLRLMISRNFDIATVQGLVDPNGDRVESFDDLTIGDYQRVLQNKDLWEKLGWSLDRRILGKHLDHIRQIRNDVMHFNPDPLPSDAMIKLRKMIELLNEYAD